MDNNTELIHYGIKGQRWGVRRFQNVDGTRTPAGKHREQSSNADKQMRNERKTEVKSRRTMSDADIRKKIERMKLEREYKSLVDEDVSPGRKYVSEIMSAAGKKALTIAAAGTIAYGIKAAMTKEFDIKEAASYIAANPNKKK